MAIPRVDCVKKTAGAFSITKPDLKKVDRFFKTDILPSLQKCGYYKMPSQMFWRDVHFLEDDEVEDYEPAHDIHDIMNYVRSFGYYADVEYSSQGGAWGGHYPLINVIIKLDESITI